MYTIVEAAKVLSVEVGQFARWVALGRIPDAVQVQTPTGPVWRVPRATIDAVARQIARSRRPTPGGTAAARAEPAKQPREARRIEPAVPWAQVERLVARERTHWQRLSELQSDTIAGLRQELEDAHRDLRHLRERLADHEQGRDADAFIGRTTLPLQREALTPIAFPELDMVG